MHTAATVSEAGFDLTIKRNCSISPQDLLGVLALAMCVSFGIACAFAWFGAWPVLPFAGIEMLALAAAFYVNGRRAGDYERIAFAGGRLLVEACDAGCVARHELDPRWTRLHERRLGGEVRLLLRSGESELEIGRHLIAERRALLAASLRRRLSH